MYNASFIRKAAKLATKLEKVMFHKYNVALATGKTQFTFEAKSYLELDLARDICREKLNYKVDSIGYLVNVQVSKEDIDFWQKLVKEIKPRFQEAIIYGDTSIIIDETKFSIYRASPILERLGFNCEVCGNEIWRIEADPQKMK